MYIQSKFNGSFSKAQRAIMHSYKIPTGIRARPDSKRV